jgi:hypothetical protein
MLAFPLGAKKMIPSHLDFGRAFTFAFEDKDWLKKFLYGAVAVLFAPVLVGCLVLFGYAKALFRGVALEGKETLPEWDRAGDYLADGVQVFIIVFVYSIPLMAVTVGPWAFMRALSTVSQLPAETARIVGCCCSWPFVAMVGLVVLLSLPVALMRFYATENLAAAFELQAIIDFVRSHFSNYILLIFVLVAAEILAWAGLFVFFVGCLFTGFWAMLVATHAMAQTWRLAREESGADGDEPFEA